MAAFFTTPSKCLLWHSNGGRRRQHTVGEAPCDCWYSIGRSHFGDRQETWQATLLVAKERPAWPTGKRPAAATKHGRQARKLQIHGTATGCGFPFMEAGARDAPTTRGMGAGQRRFRGRSLSPARREKGKDRLPR
jgi:hypothetical protein